jgi:hypothetical protein
MAGDTQHSTRLSHPSLTINAEGLSGLGNVASFRTQVSRTSFKIGFRPAQSDFAPFAFDKSNRLFFGHRLSSVALVRHGQCWWKPEPNDFAANYGCSVHEMKLTCPGLLIKRR